MWSWFWSGAAIEAVGAIFTVAIAVGSYWFARLRATARTLDGLVWLLHYRRVLHVQGVHEPNARSLRSAQAARSVESVLAIRDDIYSATKATLHDASANMALRNMYLACNRFLERSERFPKTYWAELQQLQHCLDICVHSLARRRGVEYRSPGGGALAG